MIPISDIPDYMLADPDNCKDTIMKIIPNVKCGAVSLDCSGYRCFVCEHEMMMLPKDETCPKCKRHVIAVY